MIDELFQLWIMLTGGLAIWLTTDAHAGRRRAGCWIGLAGQPFWLHATWQHSQWGMFLLTVIFTISYLRALLRPSLSKH